MPRRAAILLAIAGAIAASGTAASAGRSTVPATWKNCTAVHKRYPHGVGRSNAHDRTSGTPVRNFKHSTKLYNQAMSYNRSLDRDKDGIACEQ